MPLKQYELERKNPTTGFTEKIIYTGNLSQKPKGWRVVQRIYWYERFTGLV